MNTRILHDENDRMARLLRDYRHLTKHALAGDARLFEIVRRRLERAGERVGPPVGNHDKCHVLLEI